MVRGLNDGSSKHVYGPPQILQLFDQYKVNADNKLVITMAPQNDIWPRGSAYPKSAVAIDKNKIIPPINQTRINLNEW